MAFFSVLGAEKKEAVPCSLSRLGCSCRRGHDLSSCLLGSLWTQPWHSRAPSLLATLPACDPMRPWPFLSEANAASKVLAALLPCAGRRNYVVSGKAAGKTPPWSALEWPTAQHGSAPCWTLSGASQAMDGLAIQPPSMVRYPVLLPHQILGSSSDQHLGAVHSDTKLLAVSLRGRTRSHPKSHGSAWELTELTTQLCPGAWACVCCIQALLDESDLPRHAGTWPLDPIWCPSTAFPQVNEAYYSVGQPDIFLADLHRTSCRAATFAFSFRSMPWTKISTSKEDIRLSCRMLKSVLAGDIVFIVQQSWDLWL